MRTIKAWVKGRLRVAWNLVEVDWCGVVVVEWVEGNMLRWFGHAGRKKSEKFVKKAYE